MQNHKIDGMQLVYRNSNGGFMHVKGQKRKTPENNDRERPAANLHI